MKFRQYLTEENFNDFEVMKKHIDIFLRKSRKWIWRGTEKYLDVNWDIKKPRKNRIPSATSIVLHIMVDEEFKRQFGWKPRSEGVFVTGDINAATTYGRVYVFVPIGDYSFIWSKTVYDLFTEFHNYVDVLDDYILEKIKKLKKNDDESLEYVETAKETLRDIVKSYREDNLPKAVRSENEIMFRCKKYYLFKPEFLTKELGYNI